MYDNATNTHWSICHKPVAALQKTDPLKQLIWTIIARWFQSPRMRLDPRLNMLWRRKWDTWRVPKIEHHLGLPPRRRRPQHPRLARMTNQQQATKNPLQEVKLMQMEERSQRLVARRFRSQKVNPRAGRKMHFSRHEMDHFMPVTRDRWRFWIFPTKARNSWDS